VCACVRASVCVRVCAYVSACACSRACVRSCACARVHAYVRFSTTGSRGYCRPSRPSRQAGETRRILRVFLFSAGAPDRTCDCFLPFLCAHAHCPLPLLCRRSRPHMRLRISPRSSQQPLVSLRDPRFRACGKRVTCSGDVQWGRAVGTCSGDVQWGRAVGTCSGDVRAAHRPRIGRCAVRLVHVCSTVCAKVPRASVARPMPMPQRCHAAARRPKVDGRRAGPLRPGCCARDGAARPGAPPLRRAASPPPPPPLPRPAAAAAPALPRGGVAWQPHRGVRRRAGRSSRKTYIIALGPSW
jgi:hypothetical protein